MSLGAKINIFVLKRTWSMAGIFSTHWQILSSLICDGVRIPLPPQDLKIKTHAGKGNGTKYTII